MQGHVTGECPGVPFQSLAWYDSCYHYTAVTRILVQSPFSMCFCNEGLSEWSIHLHPCVRNVVVLGCLVAISNAFSAESLKRIFKRPWLSAWSTFTQAHFHFKWRLSLNCSFANVIYQIMATVTHIGEICNTHFSVSLWHWCITKGLFSPWIWSPLRVKFRW